MFCDVFFWHGIFYGTMRIFERKLQFSPVESTASSIEIESNYTPYLRQNIEMAGHSAIKGKLIAIIGDEDTCVGFLLGGIGEMNKARQPNFLVVDKNTSISEIEESFKRFVKRDDIDIILINQNVAEMIRHVIDSHNVPIPAVLEIPSKDHPYDPSKDSILRRAKGMFCAEDFR